jgi:threonine aldolase
VVLQVPDAARLAAAAAADGVRISALGPRVVRMVTHLDVDDDGVDQAVKVLAPLVSGG